MMIPPAGASDPYAAAAALDRRLRSPDSDADDASSDSATPESSPDVVVTLSKGSTSSSSTYDASGRMSRAPTLDDLGANSPDSAAQASESDGDDGADASSDATGVASASSSSSGDDDSSSDASVDEDATVAA